jgi:ribonuclease HI
LAYEAFKKALMWYVENNMLKEEISIYTDDYKVGKQICVQFDGKKNQKITRRYDFYEVATEVERLTRMFKNLRCIQIPKESNSYAEMMVVNYRPKS